MFSGRRRDRNVNRGRKKDVSGETERWGEREKFAEGGRVRKFVREKGLTIFGFDLNVSLAT